MDWNAVGAAVGSFVLGAAGVLRWVNVRRRRSEEPWDGATERRKRRSELTGRKVVSLIEEAGEAAQMPRHWATFVDGRVDHKLKSVLTTFVLLQDEVRAVRVSVEDLSRIIHRLIGRLLPDEPVD